MATDQIRNELESRLRDMMKEAKKADAADLALMQALELMVKNIGWGRYQTLLNSKITMFSEQLLMPSGGLDGLVASEFIKGAMFGLVLARDQPQVIIDAMKQQFGSAQAEEGAVEENK